MSAQDEFPPPEIYGPYLHAPVWPWHLAGWIVSALLALAFVIARLLASRAATRCLVLDAIFVGLTVLFFVAGIGYVAVCDRLMK